MILPVQQRKSILEKVEDSAEQPIEPNSLAETMKGFDLPHVETGKPTGHYDVMPEPDESQSPMSLKQQNSSLPMQTPIPAP